MILQRRSIRVKNDLKKDHIIKREDLVVLRPCPKESVDPRNIKMLIGKKINKDLPKHEIIRWEDLS